MYSIYADRELLYAPTMINEGCVLLSPKLTVELNKAGSLEAIMPPGNVLYENIKKLKTIITVQEDDEEIFRGRVLHDDKDFLNRKNMFCEGDLTFLLDSIQRPYTFQGDIPVLFRKFITTHNEEVEPVKQFEVGEITITDPNNYINRENQDYSKTLEEIKAKLLDTHGGYIRTRLTNGKRYVDLVEEYGKISSQVIEFGVNLLDITEYISAEDVFTVLIPLGAELTNEDGSSAGRLKIDSVNNGKDYIENETAIALFGKIWRKETWDDVTVASNLLTKGEAFLKDGIEMAVSLKIKAIDLHLINVNTERIRVGDYVRVVSVPHKLDKYFLCSKIVYDLVNPDKTEFIFGVTFKTMTEKQVNSAKAVQSTIVNVQSATQSASNSAGQANEAVKEVEQIISQMPTDYVKTKVFEEYKQEVNSKISAVYRYKGSVANYATLPIFNREIGDVWNLLDTGANYAWSDFGWDKLSETVDLSGYATKEEIPEVPKKISELENDAGYVTEEQMPTDYVDTQMFDTYKQEASEQYALKDDLPTDYVDTTTFEELAERVRLLEEGGR